MKNRVHLNDTYLFIQVAGVIGACNALLELGKVWRVRDTAKFDRTTCILSAFEWGKTPQSSNFWNDIYSGRNPYGEHHAH